MDRALTISIIVSDVNFVSLSVTMVSDRTAVIIFVIMLAIILWPTDGASGGDGISLSTLRSLKNDPFTIYLDDERLICDMDNIFINEMHCKTSNNQSWMPQ